MAKNNKNHKKNDGYKMISIIAGISLIVIALGTFWAYSFSTNMVRHELSAQRIYFPEAGSPNFSAEEYPGLQKYAGLQLVDGRQAKAYANEYIGHHLEKIAGGKTYAEVSSESMKNPTDEKLQAQKQQLFMGETLRGLLLNAYAFWTIGQLLLVVSMACLVFGGIILSTAVRSRL